MWNSEFHGNNSLSQFILQHWNWKLEERECHTKPLLYIINASICWLEQQSAAHLRIYRFHWWIYSIYIHIHKGLERQWTVSLEHCAKNKWCEKCITRVWACASFTSCRWRTEEKRVCVCVCLIWKLWLFIHARNNLFWWEMKDPHSERLENLSARDAAIVYKVANVNSKNY